ncbi:hypothetical protein PMAYCL1PPCAC_10300, partial [Pristionchus mayeri]
SIQISMNRSRFYTELDESSEDFITKLFFSIGVVSTPLSLLTFYLLIRKSSFITPEVRIALLLVQISAFLDNVHYCILFVPFIYPFVGGGFCTGILCTLGVRFHYSLTFLLITIVLLCASFIYLLFARFQTLLHPWSKLKLKFEHRLAFYICIFTSLHIIPILFAFMDTPDAIQEDIV